MKLRFYEGNLADVFADAIVIPTNKWLNEYAGSSRAVFEKAGRDELKKECSRLIKKYGPLDVNSAVPTDGFATGADKIIHAVVPRWIDGKSNEYVQLYLTYLNCMAKADQNECATIAFPLLASGNNRFDPELALEIAVQAIDEYTPHNKLREVYLVLYGKSIVNLVKKQGIRVQDLQDQQKGIKHLLEKKKAGQMLEAAGDLYKKAKDFVIDNPEVIKAAMMIVKKIKEKKDNKDK